MIGLSGDMALLMGAPTQKLGHLAGRDERVATWSPWMRDWNTTRKPVEWLVRAPGGGAVTLTATSGRAGTQRVTVALS
jgi:hypothetical protein